ncbi:hypothetical protein [Lysobacter enzymogenes]|uniref:hypothetical protein n=1 Tax=Lysobacter enzymogenes TaxID=69 RepID=UPI0019D17E42|nr:hypothetical protein [Lysobacter enzymogenes]
MTPSYTLSTGVHLVAFAVLAVVLGVCVLGSVVRDVYRYLCRRIDREYAYLREWYSSNASPVAAGHADRSEMRCTHACEPPIAAGEGAHDVSPPRPADGFYAGYGFAAAPSHEDAS